MSEFKYFMKPKHPQVGMRRCNEGRVVKATARAQRRCEGKPRNKDDSG